MGPEATYVDLISPPLKLPVGLVPRQPLALGHRAWSCVSVLGSQIDGRLRRFGPTGRSFGG